MSSTMSTCTAGDVPVEVLEDPDDAGGLRARAVRGDGHPVGLDRLVQPPGEVRHDHDGALEDADQQRVPAGVVGVDLRGELGQPGQDLLLGEQDLLQVLSHVAGVHVTPWSSAGWSRLPRRGERSLPHAPAATTPPGRCAPPLPAPPDDEGVEGEHVPPTQRAAGRSGARARPRAAPAGGRRPARRRGPRRRAHGVRAARPGRPRASCRVSRRAPSRVERVGVLRAGRAGQRGGQTGAERRRRAAVDGVPHPGPGVGRVGVRRVVCGSRPRSAQAGAGRRHGGTEQRPHASGRGAAGMPGERPGARPAGQPEQHRLGLVVEGVAEQDGDAPCLGGRRAPGRRSGQRGPRPPVRRDRWPPARRRPRPRPGRGPARGGARRGPRRRLRTRVPAVVDHGGARAAAGPRRHEGGRGGERERVGAAGAGDEHEGPGGIASAPTASRRAAVGHRRSRGGHGPRATCRGPAGVAAGRRSRDAVSRGPDGPRRRDRRSRPAGASVSGDAQTALKPSVPTRP